MKPKKVVYHDCKDCGEVSLYEREPGLWVCATCGRMTTKKPRPLPVKLRADFGRKSGVKRS